MPPKGYRCKTVYLESDAQLRRWEEAAFASQMNFNRWIRAIVEDYLSRSEDEDHDRGDEIIRSKQDETIRLRKELDRLRLELQSKETELFRLKAKPLAQDVGYMELDGRLLEILQDRCSWSNKDLLEALGVDSRDVDAISAIASLLHKLQDLGLVKEGPRGWRWIANA
jgi:hypothetical protein